MNHQPTQFIFLVSVAAIALSVMDPSIATEPPYSAKVQILALEKRVTALEELKEAETTARSSTPMPRRRATEAVRSSATEVERYLQYPGQ